MGHPTREYGTATIRVFKASSVTRTGICMKEVGPRTLCADMAFTYTQMGQSIEVSGAKE